MRVLSNLHALALVSTVAVSAGARHVESEGSNKIRSNKLWMLYRTFVAEDVLLMISAMHLFCLFIDGEGQPTQQILKWCGQQSWGPVGWMVVTLNKRAVQWESA